MLEQLKKEVYEANIIYKEGTTKDEWAFSLAG